MRTALFLIAVLAAPAAADDAQPLKWTFKEGEKFFAKNETVNDMNVMIMGQSVDVKMTYNVVQRFKILSAKPDSTTVELTILSMEMAATGIPGGIPGGADMGDRVKGATLTAVLDANAGVTKLQGYDKFLDKMAGEDETSRKMLQNMMSESTMKQMFSQVFSFGNTKPVKPGDTWQRDDKINMGGMEAVTKVKYKLNSVNNGIAKMGWSGDMTFKAGNGFPGLPPGLAIDKFDMKADKFEGTIKFDTKLGRLVESKQDADVTGAITLGAMGQKFEMKMTMKVTQTVTIDDKNPIKD